MGKDDPLWYKDAILYEVHVRAFQDSDGDGVGDLRGLTERLDYIRDLGVTAIWLLPFYPSPLRDDGYDIADYTAIHPDYGTVADFRRFLHEAHRRGLRVITELVLNHTSDQHPWFQKARRSPPGSPARDFYVWSDTPDRYPDARIIFKDFESSNWAWDPVARAYYWHRFYFHQPDLNYDNLEVRRAMFAVVDFWLGMGVDGLRLDAVPYLYEREGTICENLPHTHAFLKALRQHVDERFPGRMLLAEANQWPEDAIAYFGQGDECHTAFHFPLMPRLFMALRMEDRFPLLDILEQTPAIPDACQWVLFLRNHDELTLEMVTDEERDYMYRVYARDPHAQLNLGIRRRLAPLLENDRRKIEIMNALLLSLPGTPVIYYGDEIGMGDNIYLGDRNGVRTPMQWTGDRNAGFSTANPQRLYLPIIIDPEYNHEALNVAAEQNNPSSLLWWMKRIIALRKRYRAFGRGSLQFLHPDNHSVLAFVRRHGDEVLLVVANLSRFVQYVELNLAEFEGREPVEVLSRARFPAIGPHPYPFTLAPYFFCWLALKPQRAPARTAILPSLRAPTVVSQWEELTREPARSALAEVLPDFLRSRPWFLGKNWFIRSAQVMDAVPLPCGPETVQVVLVRVEYLQADPEVYLLFLARATGERAEHLNQHAPQRVVASLEGDAGGVLYEAAAEPWLYQALLEACAHQEHFPAGTGELVASVTGAFAAASDTAAGDKGETKGGGEVAPEPLIDATGLVNPFAVFANRMILKLWRCVEEGIDPDLEVGRFLTDKNFPHTPPLLGALEYRRGRWSEPFTLGILQGFVPNARNAWQAAVRSLGQYFERALASQVPPECIPVWGGGLLDLAGREVPPSVQEMMAAYLDGAELLGRRTAELHAALACDAESPAFAPEPFSPHHQRSLYQSARGTTGQVLENLARRVPDLPPDVREQARRLLDRKDTLLQHFRSILDGRITGWRIRCHHAYYLDHVLYTGKDFLIIDFGGEPLSSLSQRRIKRSPLWDVACMVRSFHYAVTATLLRQAPGPNGESGVIRPEDVPALRPWARCWLTWASAAFLKGYLGEAGQGPLLPEPAQRKVVFGFYLLEKAVQELGHELDHRPAWVNIPIEALLEMLDAEGG